MNVEHGRTTGAGELPRVRTPLGVEELLGRLDRASRNGRMAGFRARAEGRFEVEAFASPFSHVLLGSPARESEGTLVRFALKRQPLAPAAFMIVSVLTVWPGAWLTDSLISTYWPRYGVWSERWWFLTWAWYLPIAVLPLPWLWGAMSRKSRTEAMESAFEAIDRIAREGEGRVEA